jgi:hypothetical protein
MPLDNERDFPPRGWIFSQLPFSKGGKIGIFKRVLTKLSSLWKREDWRDFWEGLFKT